MAVPYQPIWQDYYASVPFSDGSVRFRIKANATVIYEGRAVPTNGASSGSLDVKMNDVISDYLSNIAALSEIDFEFLSRFGFPVSFALERYNGSSWVSVDSAKFMNDWSYDGAFTPGTDGLAYPINGHIDIRQWLVWTANRSILTVAALITKKDGTTASDTLDVAVSSSFEWDRLYGSSFVRSVQSAGYGSALFNLAADYPTMTKVRLDGTTTYEVVTDCAKYALYYLNAYGGWDTFLIEGNSLELDDVDRHTTSILYDNRGTNNTNRGERTNINEITRSWELHTGWLSDTEAGRMHHLLNSPDVFLCEIATDRFYPVIITGNPTEYKTFKNRGRTAVTYTINAKLAQFRARR